MSDSGAATWRDLEMKREACTVIMLTQPQAEDLRYLVALFRLTIGITRQQWARGDSVRTGRALARKGLVELAKIQFANRVSTWVPSRAGLEYVETNFRADGGFDVFAAEATARASAALRGMLW